MKPQCLKNDIFIRCITGDLSESEKALTLKHLSECDECLEDFTTVKLLLFDKEFTHWEPVLHKHQQVNSMFTDLSGNFRKFYKWLEYKLTSETDMFFKYAAVRSPDKSESLKSIQFSKIKDNIQLFMQVEKTKNSLVNIRIKVFEQEEMIKRGRIILIGGDGSAMSCLLKENGEGAVFENLYFGIYRLIIKQNSVEKDDFFIEAGHEGVEFKDDLS